MVNKDKFRWVARFS